MFFCFFGPCLFNFFLFVASAAATGAADAATAADAAVTAAASVNAGAEATATCYTQDFVIWLTGLLLSLNFFVQIVYFTITVRSLYAIGSVFVHGTCLIDCLDNLFLYAKCDD